MPRPGEDNQHTDNINLAKLFGNLIESGFKNLTLDHKTTLILYVIAKDALYGLK